LPKAPKKISRYSSVRNKTDIIQTIMWELIKNSGRPVVLYGTGNAAEKILRICEEKDISIAGIFASDDFVRNRSFAGIPVISYSEAKARFGYMTVLLCFGTHLEPVIENIKRIDREQDLYAPDLPIAGGGIFDAEYCKEHKSDFVDIMDLLADRKSREVLSGVINYKLSGKLNYLFDIETSVEDNYALLDLGPDESYVDLGAYNGDTIELFLNCAGGDCKSIIAMEPEKRNFRKLSNYCEGLNMENVFLYNMAASSGPAVLEFQKGSGRGGQANTGKTIEIPADSVDNIIAKLAEEGRDIHPTFIKMDLEGMEEEALKGAENTIKNDKPKMLVSAYHRNSDLFNLPKKVLAMNPSYKVYLRHSPCVPAWEVDYFFV